MSRSLSVPCLLATLLLFTPTLRASDQCESEDHIDFAFDYLDTLDQSVNDDNTAGVLDAARETSALWGCDAEAVAQRSIVPSVAETHRYILDVEECIARIEYRCYRAGNILP